MYQKETLKLKNQCRNNPTLTLVSDNWHITTCAGGWVQHFQKF